MLCGVNFIAGYEALMVAKKVLSHTTRKDGLKWSENLFFAIKIEQDSLGRGGGVIHAHAQAVQVDCAHRFVQCNFSSAWFQLQRSILFPKNTFNKITHLSQQ